MPVQRRQILPKTRVFFPKYVRINNTQLAILYWLVWLVTMGIAVYQFVQGRRYELKMLPEGEVSTCSTLCPPRIPVSSASAYCSASYPAGSFAAPFEDSFSCAPICSSSAAGFCLHQSDLIQYGSSTIFIPTAYQERILHQPASVVTGGTCTVGTASANGQVCTEVNNYWVPGVEQQEIEFTHRFKVERPESFLGDEPDVEGDSMENVATMLLKADGSKRKIYNPGETLKFTVAELLSFAGIDEIGGSSNEAGVDLDAKYSRPHVVGGAQLPTVRLTGVTIGFDIFFTNEGACQKSFDSERVSAGDIDTNELACIVIKADRQWTGVEKTYQYNVDGSEVSRQFTGISIKFHVAGSFKFWDGGQIFRGLTTFLIWHSIPICILYFFVILFLGKVSVIYNRVIHQELSLSGGCIGLAGRLISHTSAFTDVRDTPIGLTKHRLHERFKTIMQFTDDLDDNEIQKFVDFVFDDVAVASATGSESVAEFAEEAELIDVQDFCTVCGSNEMLTFDALVQIFDRDRTLNYLESLFVDDVITQSRNPQSIDEMNLRVKSAMVRTQDSDRYNALGGAPAAGAFTTDHLTSRCEFIEDEINNINNECDRLISKQDIVKKQIANAEATLARLQGGTTII